MPIIGSTRCTVDEYRAGTSIGRCGGEWIVGNEEHLVADFCVTKALAAGEPRVAVGYVGDPASGTESVRFGGINAGDDEGLGCHVLIVVNPGRLH